MQICDIPTRASYSDSYTRIRCFLSIYRPVLQANPDKVVLAPMIGRHDVRAGSPYYYHYYPELSLLFFSSSLLFPLAFIHSIFIHTHSKMTSFWNYLSLPTAVFTSPIAAILTPVTAGALVGYTTTSGRYSY